MSFERNFWNGNGENQTFADHSRTHACMHQTTSYIGRQGAHHMTSIARDEGLHRMTKKSLDAELHQTTRRAKLEGDALCKSHFGVPKVLSVSMDTVWMGLQEFLDEIPSPP